MVNKWPRHGLLSHIRNIKNIKSGNASRQSKIVHQGKRPNSFAHERLLFSTRASSVYLHLQLYLNQDCHNQWVGQLGRDHRSEVQCEPLERTQIVGELFAPHRMVARIQWDTCNKRFHFACGGVRENIFGL